MCKRGAKLSKKRFTIFEEAMHNNRRFVVFCNRKKITWDDYNPFICYFSNHELLELNEFYKELLNHISRTKMLAFFKFV